MTSQHLASCSIELASAPSADPPPACSVPTRRAAPGGTGRGGATERADGGGCDQRGALAGRSRRDCPGGHPRSPIGLQHRGSPGQCRRAGGPPRPAPIDVRREAGHLLRGVGAVSLLCRRAVGIRHCVGPVWKLVPAGYRAIGRERRRSFHPDVHLLTGGVLQPLCGATDQGAFRRPELSNGDYTVLQPSTPEETSLYNTYTSAKYFPSAPGGLPFADFGNRVVVSSSSYNPDVLHGLSREQIATDLTDPTSPVTVDIVATANYLSAAICLIDGDRPGSVCQSSGVRKSTHFVKISYGYGVGGCVTSPDGQSICGGANDSQG
jgi:hypothetical protein